MSDSIAAAAGGMTPETRFKMIEACLQQAWLFNNVLQLAANNVARHGDDDLFGATTATLTSHIEHELNEAKRFAEGQVPEN